jgi:C_GCAxxG_C_C family probable redox protein
MEDAKMQNNKASDLARDYFAQKFNCAEATALGLTEALGMREECIPRIATGFGAGGGRCGELCGALAGAVMVLGLKFGRDTAEDAEAREVTFNKVQELYKSFQEEFGSVRCIELTEIDMTTPEGMELAKARKLHTDFCPKFVVFAAARAQQLVDS